MYIHKHCLSEESSNNCLKLGVINKRITTCLHPNALLNTSESFIVYFSLLWRQKTKDENKRSLRTSWVATSYTSPIHSEEEEEEESFMKKTHLPNRRGSEKQIWSPCWRPWTDPNTSLNAAPWALVLSKNTQFQMLYFLFWHWIEMAR